MRQEAAQRLGAFAQVAHFRAVFGRAIERRIGNRVVRNRDVEAVAELAQRFFAHFLLRVGDHLAFAGFTHAVAFDGLAENDRGLAGVRHGGGVGGVNLVRVVAAAVEPPDVVVAHAGDEGFKFGIFTEGVFAHIGAVDGLHGLIFAVDGFFGFGTRHPPQPVSPALLGSVVY